MYNFQIEFWHKMAQSIFEKYSSEIITKKIIIELASSIIIFFAVVGKK
jgi:hypothetical protein